MTVCHGKVAILCSTVQLPASMTLFRDDIELYSDSIAFYYDRLSWYSVGMPWHGTITVPPMAWYSWDAGPLHCGAVDQHTLLNKG